MKTLKDEISKLIASISREERKKNPQLERKIKKLLESVDRHELGNASGPNNIARYLSKSLLTN